MGKLQPNFSWQKYEGKAEDKEQQFQYQLQSQHILVSNSVNSTIDDESFFTRERQTSFTWTDNRAIYTKTFKGTIVGTSQNATAHNITGLRELVKMYGSVQNAIPMTVFAAPMSYIDPTTLANGLGLYISPTQYFINAANNDFNGYLYSLTIEYTKT